MQVGSKVTFKDEVSIVLCGAGLCRGHGGAAAASEVDKLPLGVFYENTKPTFEERLTAYETSREPLFRRRPDLEKLSRLIASKRGRT